MPSVVTEGETNMARQMSHSVLDLLRNVRSRKFSRTICLKFPVQTGRHIACPSNARWMLRNIPTSSLSNTEISELADWAQRKS